MNIITNMSLLKDMQKAGLIKFTEETGIKITGLYDGESFICHYIDDLCEGIYSPFEYKGIKYKLIYISGCFYPYIVG